MSFEELAGAHAHLGEAGSYLRPIVNVPVNPDPAGWESPIYLAALGPDQVSTSTALVPLSALPIWDVNRYYRAIGIDWPYRPTRAQMRRAFQVSGGHGNDYATYALKRLLDNEFRAHYDQRKLGEPVDDAYRWEDLKRMASQWAREQSAVTGRVVSVADILGDDLTRKMAAEAEAERRGQEIADRTSAPSADVSHEDLPYVWPYGYYLWGSLCRDEIRLERWQLLLIESFSRVGLSLQVAVGYLDRAGAAAARTRHRRPDGTTVEILFLHQEEEPTARLADVVVGTYQNHPHGTLQHPLYLPHGY